MFDLVLLLLFGVGVLWYGKAAMDNTRRPGQRAFDGFLAGINFINGLNALIRLIIHLAK